MKRCYHRKILPMEMVDKQTSEVDRTFFAPVCVQSSFQWVYLRMGQTMQATLLEYHLDQNPISCPKACTYYENRNWGRLKKVLKSIGLLLKSGLHWFSKAPWQTQIAIIGSVVLIMILALFPRFLPFLTDMIKAFRK
jgi:hypothetical protein